MAGCDAVHINLSPATEYTATSHVIEVADGQLGQRIAAILASSGITPARLELELTELMLRPRSGNTQKEQLELRVSGALRLLGQLSLQALVEQFCGNGRFEIEP